LYTFHLFPIHQQHERLLTYTLVYISPVPYLQRFELSLECDSAMFSLTCVNKTTPLT